MIVGRTATRAALERSLRQIQGISLSVASEPSQELLYSGNVRHADLLIVDATALGQLLRTRRSRCEGLMPALPTVLALNSEELLQAYALLNLVDAWLFTDVVDPGRLVTVLMLAEAGYTALPAGLDPSAKIATLRIQAFHNLSRAEQLTLLTMAKGTSNAQIAAELGLSEDRTKTLVRNIFRKLQFRNRTQASIFVARHIARTSNTHCFR